MRQQKIGNLAEPHRREDRERRAIAGLEGSYEVTRTGLIWSLGQEDWVEPATSWPFVKLVHNDSLLDLNLVEILALSWLSPQQRAALRALGPQEKPWSAKLLAKEVELQVPVYSLACAANSSSDEDFEHWTRLKHGEDAAVFSVEGAKLDDYKAFLCEYYRPPSKGGNTRALHAHVLYIGGERYSFFALGAKKWVFASDTTSFKYRVTEAGHRNVLRDTLVTRDKAGLPVVRGHRGHKSVLRTAPTRLPGSRRERNS